MGVVILRGGQTIYVGGVEMTIGQAKEKYFACMEKYAPKNEKWSFKKTMNKFDFYPIEKSYDIVFHDSIKEYFNIYSHTMIFGDCALKFSDEVCKICIILDPTLHEAETSPNDFLYSKHGFVWALDLWMKNSNNDKTHTPIGVDGGDWYNCCDVVVNNLTGKIKIDVPDDAGRGIVQLEEIIADDLADLISKMADSLDSSFFVNPYQSGN